MHYSGSPLAFSFSEEAHVKSVTLIDVDTAGVANVSIIPVPVGRTLITLRGDLDTLLQDQALRVHAESWVRVVLTDERRPDHAMSRLRDVWPYTVDLDFDARRPANDSHGPALGLASADPVLLAQSFVEHVTATPPTPEESAALQRSVEAVRIGEVPE
jgi:exonuclease SbcD